MRRTARRVRQTGPRAVGCADARGRPTERPVAPKVVGGRATYRWLGLAGEARWPRPVPQVRGRPRRAGERRPTDERSGAALLLLRGEPRRLDAPAAGASARRLDPDHAVRPRRR